MPLRAKIQRALRRPVTSEIRQKAKHARASVRRVEFRRSRLLDFSLAKKRIRHRMSHTGEHRIKAPACKGQAT